MTQIDQAIVQMKFDNDEFEKRSRETMSTLDKLHSKLTLKDSAKSMQQSMDAINAANFDSLAKSADRYGDTLDNKIIAKLAIVQNLMNKVITAGENMVKSLAIDPVSSGWDKYQNKLSQTQTIMNATGKSATEVDKYLDKLAWYADETSYSFDDMTRAVGNFTASGVQIDKAIPAVIGIANAGGLAGTSIQNVSHAMEGFAKAIGQGYMQANQWDWIETARMNTEATKQAFIDAAVELGRLQKQADGSYLVTGTKDKFVSASDFTAQFRTGWLDTEVMLRGLQNFGDYSEAVFQKVQEEGLLTAEAMDALSGQYNALGEQGMRAAQESKTLEDAIQAVRDAVSSGWSKTFQILFGGFEDAKELWSIVYEELYNIFGISGEVRNELLEGWADLGGREVLLETIAEGWQQIKDIVGAVKEGISEIIPPKTAQQLYDATVRFKEFIASLRLSQDALYSLKVIAKTLAIPLKILGIAAKAAGLGLKILIYYSNRAVNTILMMASNTEYAAEMFQKMFKFLFGEVNGERIYNSLTTIFNNISSTITTKVDELKKRFANSGLDDIFTLDNLKEGLRTFKEIIGEFTASLLEAIETGDWSKFGKGITTILDTMGDKLKGATSLVKTFATEVLHLEELRLPELPFDNFKEFLKYLKDILDELNPFGEALDIIKDKGSGMIESIKAITSAIVEFCKNLSPSKILLFGFGLAIIDLIAQFSRLTSAAATVVTSFSGIGKSAKGILDAIKYRISPVESKFKNIGNLAIKVAVAFTILAGALTLLASVPAPQLREVTDTMLKMSGALAGIVALIGILGIVGSKLGGAADDINGLGFSMIAFAVAIGTLTAALYMMDSIDTEEVRNKLLLIAGVVAGVAVAIRVLGTFSANTMDQNVKGILAFAAAILLITLAINQIDPEKTVAAIPYLITLFGMISVLMLAMGKAGAGAKDASKALTKIANSLLLMNVVLLLLGASITHFPVEMSIGAVVGLIELLTMLGVLFLISKAAGVNALGAGKGLREISSALALLIIPIIALGLLPLNVLAKGITVVGILSTALAAISLLASLGKNKQMSKGLLQVAATVALLIIPITILGALPQDVVWKGIGAVGTMLVLIGLLSQLGSVSKGAKLSIMPAVAAIGLFTTAILLLTIPDWEDVLFATSMLTIAVTALGASMRMMTSVGKNAQPTAIAPLIVSVVAIGVLIAGLIGILKTTEDLDAKDAAIKMGGIALVIAALGVAMKLMTSHAKQSSKIKNDKALIAEEIGLLALIMAEIAGVMTIMNNTYADPETIIANAIALSSVLVAVGVAARIMSSGDTDYKLAKENAIALGAFIAEAAIAIGLMSALGTDKPEVILANAAALSMVVVATASAARIMVKGKKDFALAEDAAIAAGIFMGEATVMLWILGSLTEGMDPNDLVIKAGALSLVIITTAAAALILSQSKGKFEGAIPVATSMSLLLVGISGALWILSQIQNTDGLYEKVLGMVAVLMAVGLLAVALDHVQLKFGALGGILEALGVIGLVAAIVFAVAGLVGLLIGLIDEQIYNQAIKGLDYFEGILAKVGAVFGGFIGGFISGVMDQSTANLDAVGERISSFISTLIEAVQYASGYDSSLLDNLTNFVSAVDLIKEAINKVKGVNADKLGGFSEALAVFGEKYAAFAEKVQGVTDTTVTSGVTAISTLATMTETLAGIKNYPDVSKFSEVADEIAPVITKFSESVEAAKFSPAKLTAAAEATKIMVEVCDSLATGNVEWVLSGSKLSEFGSQLGDFGVGYGKFAENIKTVDQTVVDSVIATASSISEFAKGLPFEGGLLGMLMGNAISLGTFAEDIGKFGENWPKFAENIAPAAQYSDSVKACASAAEAISTLYNKLPKEDGWAQTLVGDTMSLTEFAAQLNGTAADGSDGFALNWVKFAKEISPASTYSDDVKTASAAAVEVAKIYSGLPTEGSAFTTWFTGEKFTLSSFGADLSTFGANFSVFSYHASKVNKQDCIDAAEAAKAVIDVYSQLPSTGGWLDQQLNGTQIDMATFSQTIKDMGKALYDFNISAGDVSYSRVLTLSQAMASVVETSKKMGEFKTKNVDNFKNNIEKLKTAFSELKATVTELPTSTSVEAAISSFDAIFGDDVKWTTYGENVLNAAKIGIANKAPDFAAAVVAEIQKALNDNKSTLTTALQELIKECTKTARENTVVKSKIQQVGKDMLAGIVKGLKDTTSVSNLNKAVADALLNAVKAGKAAIESHSPSKLTKREWGKNMMTGAAQGVEEDKTLDETTTNVLKKYVSKFADYLSNPEELAKAIQNGVKALADIVIPSAAEQGRTVGESFGKGIVEGLSSVNFNRSTIAFGRNLESYLPGIRELAKELGIIDVKALKSAREANIASGFYIQGDKDNAALTALMDKVNAYDLNSVPANLTEWKKIVSSLDFDSGFTFDDLSNYLNHLDMDKLSATTSVAVKKLKPIVENLQDGLDVISSFETFIEGSNLDSKKNTDSYKKYEAIANNLSESIKVIGEVEEAVHDLEGLSGYNLTLAQTSTNRIAALTKALEEQVTLVSESESRYLKTVADFGTNSEQASKALSDWTKQKLQLKSYQTELDEINKNGGKLFITSTTEYATIVLDTVRDYAAELKDYIGTEGNAYVELVDRLQQDIADGIINDPRIVNAIAERFDDIMSMFDGLVSSNESVADLMDQEYTIWEKTKGRDASEAEKQAKKLELVNQKLEKSAERQYYLDAARVQAIAMFGEGSDEALAAQKKYNDAYLEAIELAEEKLSLENQIAEATKNGTSATKGLTAREKAEKEFQEWKKDGSLRDWHYYGATDEELMEALIKKYEDDEKQAKKEQEANAEFVASFDQINSVLKETVSALDISKLDANISTGLLGVANLWGKELAETLANELQNYRSSYGYGTGGAGGNGYGTGGYGIGGSSQQVTPTGITAANVAQIINDGDFMSELWNSAKATAVFDIKKLQLDASALPGDEADYWNERGGAGMLMYEGGMYKKLADDENNWVSTGKLEQFELTAEQLITKLSEYTKKASDSSGNSGYVLTGERAFISEESFNQYISALGEELGRMFNERYIIQNTEGNFEALMDENQKSANELRSAAVSLAGVINSLEEQTRYSYVSDYNRGLSESIAQSKAANYARKYEGTAKYEQEYNRRFDEEYKKLMDMYVKRGEGLKEYEQSDFYKLQSWLSGTADFSASESKQFLTNLSASNDQLSSWATNFDTINWEEVRKTFQYISAIGASDLATKLVGGSAKMDYEMLMGDINLEFDSEGNVTRGSSLTKGVADLIPTGFDLTKIGYSVVYDADGNAWLVPMNQVTELVNQGYRYYQGGKKATDLVTKKNPYSDTGSYYGSDNYNSALSFGRGIGTNKTYDELMSKYQTDKYGVPITPTDLSFEGVSGQTINASGSQFDLSGSLGTTTNIATGNLNIPEATIQNVSVPDVNQVLSEVLSPENLGLNEYVSDANSVMGTWNSVVDTASNALDNLSSKFDEWGVQDKWNNSQLKSTVDKAGTALGESYSGAFDKVMSSKDKSPASIAAAAATSINSTRDLYSLAGTTLSNSLYSGYMSQYNQNEQVMIGRAKATATTISSILSSASGASAGPALSQVVSSTSGIKTSGTSAKYSSGIASSLNNTLSSFAKSLNNTVASAGSKTVNLNYNQTITSPKAVSRYDVYRDTNNLLSRTKGVVNRV